MISSPHVYPYVLSTLVDASVNVIQNLNASLRNPNSDEKICPIPSNIVSASSPPPVAFTVSKYFMASDESEYQPEASVFSPSVISLNVTNFTLTSIFSPLI